MQSQCQRCLQMGSEQVQQVSHDASTHMEKLRRCTDGGGWGVSFLVSSAPRRHFLMSGLVSCVAQLMRGPFRHSVCCQERKQ